jgi:uncharacterized repeat protein (TIGR03803 family)
LALSKEVEMGLIHLGVPARTAIALLIVVWAAEFAQGQKFEVLYNFSGRNDGGSPTAGVICDQEGNLYGATALGGADGAGTVFKLSKDGKESVLYNFTGYSDGLFPDASLLRDPAGNLYGVTVIGGYLECKDLTGGCGVVFKVDANGSEATVHVFRGHPYDGAGPYAPVIRDGAGRLYGTTPYGGEYEQGTVYKISKSGDETILHSFEGGRDGTQPFGGLVEDAKGNLYGTTYLGGSHNGGTVFKLSPSGKKTVLYNFRGGADGGYPYTSLVLDVQGNLYGTTTGGGANAYGAVFKLTRSSKETVLYSFRGGTSDGSWPLGLIRNSQGDIFGTTLYRGTSNEGTVYKLSGTGQETILHNFTGGKRDGNSPYGTLLEDSKGDLYGTTEYGGTFDNGVAFEITPR